MMTAEQYDSIRYIVWNTHDEITASPDVFTREEAEQFVKDFPKRYEKQGYFSSRGQRIPLENIKLDIRPFPPSLPFRHEFLDNLIDALEEHLLTLIDDQETGFDEGLYETPTTDTIENLKELLAMVKAAPQWTPKVLIKISGGILDNVTSNSDSVEVTVCDEDNHRNGSEAFTYFEAVADEVLTDEAFEQRKQELEEQYPSPAPDEDDV
jgi:hypothetical protein